MEASHNIQRGQSIAGYCSINARLNTVLSDGHASSNSTSCRDAAFDPDQFALGVVSNTGNSCYIWGHTAGMEINVALFARTKLKFPSREGT